MNILVLYNATQTYTNTVYEHLNGFAKYSNYKYFFCHNSIVEPISIDIERFDIIIIHYSIRLPYDQIHSGTVDVLKKFSGLKVVFVQDEYDYTKRVWHWINELGIKLLFSVVPEGNISLVYPENEIPGVKVVNNLTGYVPEEFLELGKPPLPSTRKLLIGYRGRPLPIRYGLLGQEKILVGKVVKEYCLRHNLSHDIEWTEESRIYGQKWYEFVLSCRSMLGSESGSNVFDWDGTLVSRIDEYKKLNKNATDADVYEAYIASRDQHGLMNQISPRVFEAISLWTVLVLFEGTYSEVLVPGVHYIPLKKDGSNLDEISRMLMDGDYLDSMAERAYQDVIASGKYSYKSFVGMVDAKIASCISPRAEDSDVGIPMNSSTLNKMVPTQLTTRPVRALPPLLSGYSSAHKVQLVDIAYRIWSRFPAAFRERSKPYLKKVLGKG